MQLFIPGYIVSETRTGEGRELFEAYTAACRAADEQQKREAKLALSRFFGARCGERDAAASEFLSNSANGIYAVRRLGVVLNAKERKTDGYFQAVHWK